MDVQRVDLTSSHASEHFTQSLVETGFAVLTNHTVDTDLIFQVYREWEAFFASEEKHQYLFDKNIQEGYFPFLAETAKTEKLADLKEFYHYYPWGRLPQGMSSATVELRQQLMDLAVVLLQWIEKHTPQEIAETFSMPLTEMVRDSQRTLFRILHYPPLNSVNYEKGAIRAAAHEDINLITLLTTATAPGLQVLDKQNNWRDVSCDPGMIVVNAADMLQLCSKHYYRSTTHRVVNPEGELANKSRLSIPLFLHANDDVQLSPELTANQYRLQRLREIGLLK